MSNVINNTLPEGSDASQLKTTLPEGKDAPKLRTAFIVKDHLKNRVELVTEPGRYQGVIEKAGARLDASGGEHLWVLLVLQDGRGIFASWNLASEGGRNALAYTLARMGIEVLEDLAVLITESLEGDLQEGNARRDGTKFLNFRPVWDK